MRAAVRHYRASIAVRGDAPWSAWFQDGLFGEGRDEFWRGDRGKPGILKRGFGGTKPKALGLGPLRQIEDKILNARVAPIDGANQLFGDMTATIQNIGFGELIGSISRRERAIRIAADRI